MFGKAVLLVAIAAMVAQFKSCLCDKPNIILLIADDQGYYDIGYRGSEIQTPELDGLAAAGVKLENYYTQQLCTPSRGTLMTGRYTIHTGMQHDVFMPGQRVGMPLDFPVFPQKLQELGYTTHMVGKWHLGYHMKEYTPTYRGFDTFFGYYSSHIDHYTKIHSYGGYDNQFNQHEDLSIFWNNTVYSTLTYGQRAVDIIRNHDQSNPLFMDLSFAAPHDPMQVPDEYLDLYDWVEDPNRKRLNGDYFTIKFQNKAMMTCFDDAVRNITDALKEVDMFDNTYIIYVSDNGGEVLNSGSNWPLRGGKWNYYEGGVKAISFVSSPLLPSPGTVSNELMHISDWYPTMIHLAGGDTEGLEIDGYNQWESICCGQPTARDEIMHNIDPLEEPFGENLYPDIFDVRVTATLRSGDWKIMTGGQDPPALIERPPLGPDMAQYDSSSHQMAEESSKRTKRQAEKNIRLFNIADDPLESNDLSETQPEIVEYMLQRLAFYNSTAWEALVYTDYIDPDYDYDRAHFPWP